MIQLPPGFSLSALYGDLFGLAAPLVSIAFLIGTGLLLSRILTRL
jgi:hypothetical protein